MTSLADQFKESRLNHVMYALILIVAFFVIYFVVVRYAIVHAVTSNKVTAEIMTNGLQEFTDGIHPVISVKATARLESMITIRLNVDGQELNFTSGDYTTSYTRLIVLPTEAQGKELKIEVTVEDRAGNTKTKRINLKTKVKEEVSFSVR